jgi:uncharacterized membrane protein
VVVGGNNDRGWRWTQGTGQVSLPLLPGALSNYNPALGVSADGRYVVGQGRASVGYRAYRYDATDGSIAALPASVGGTVVDAGRAISPDGQIVAGSAHDKLGRWTNGVLDVAASNSSGTYIRYQMTDDGSTIVGSAIISATVDQGIIWDATHGLREIKQALTADYGLGPAMTGWTFTAVNDISGDGKALVGTGTDPNGFTQAFLVIVPEPGTATLAVIAGAWVIAARRQRR